MNPTLVQPPPRVDLVEITQDRNGKMRGKITRPWQSYLDDFFARVGGAVAPSNTELADQMAGSRDAVALGVFGRQPAPISEPADVRYVAAFLPRQQAVQTPPDDASAVICARVFAARN